MITAVGVLFTEILICAGMIVTNPALDLLVQDKSNECKQHNPSCLCYWFSWLYGLANSILVDDIFSCSEEKAERKSAGYEGGWPSSFASIFVDLISSQS